MHLAIVFARSESRVPGPDVLSLSLFDHCCSRRLPNGTTSLLSKSHLLMYSTTNVWKGIHAHFDEKKERPTDSFVGRSITRRMAANNQFVRAAWKEEQLKKCLFPSFERVFRALGYDNVDWWKLLEIIAFGGEVKLKGPKFPNISEYTDETIDHFMISECAMAKALLNCVFSKEDNLAYTRESTTIEVAGTLKKCTPNVEFRRSVITFKALDHPDRAFYRVSIDGRQGRVTRLFQFQPSIAWVCTRFPENCT